MEEKIALMVAEERPFLTAETYLRKWNSFSKPRLVACVGGGEYVVKGSQIGRAVCNEQIVARLGLLLGAPVGEPVFVVVPDALRNGEPELSHIAQGLAHGCKYHPDHSDRLGIAYADVPENRARFCALSILYGWAHAGDRQLIYPNSPPRLVLSVDHGHFFPGGPNWAVANLSACPAAAPFPEIVSLAGLDPEDFAAPLERLSSITEEELCRAVSAPPNEWGLTIPDRVAIAGFLWSRREHLLASLRN